VEEAMRVIDQSRMSPDDALEHIAGLLSEQSFARAHLENCGAGVDLAVRWANAQYIGPGEDGLDEAFPASLEEITAALGADASGVIERLLALDVVESTADGWVLDRAVLAAALALQ
jgi:hypothetical protein